VTKPKGVNTAPSGPTWEKDHTTETAYDLLDRQLSLTQYAVDAAGNVDPAATRVTKHCYDDAGDLRSLTGPKGSAGLTSCPNPAAMPYAYTSATHTTKFEYDAAHRQVKQTDALGRTNQVAYDANSQVISQTDATGKVATSEYDSRGLKTKTVEPFDAGRSLTSISEYDALGNLKRFISPRAFDAAGGQAPYTSYVESYTYDALERLVTTTLPRVVGPDYDSVVLADSPVGYWRMHSAPAAESNLGSGGSALNLGHFGTVSTAPGALDEDGAARYNGSSWSGVAVNPGSYGLGASNVTLEAWVEVPDTARKGAFVHAGNGGNGYALGVGGWNFDNTGNRLIGLFEGVRWIDGGVNIGTGWHHVAMSIAGCTATFYLDGAQVSSSAGGCAMAPTGAVDVGGYGIETRRFNGTVDEAAIYAGVLPAARVQAHYAARSASGTMQAHRHQAYDANGQTLWTSLPTLAASPAGVTQDEKTTLAFWDTGAIYASQDPATPKVRFDYTAEGWQMSRIPETVPGSGVLNYGQAMYWKYLADGLLESLVDPQSQRARYAYDANGQRIQAHEGTGLVSAGQTPMTIDLTYNSLDELTKVRTPKPSVVGTYLATTVAYDLHGNTSTLVDNQEENTSGIATSAGRSFAYTHDPADQVTVQTDDFGTAADQSDDEQLTYSYTPRGQLETRTLSKRVSGAWDDTQSSIATYFDNGVLKQLTNRNGATTPAVISEHTLGYIRDGVYLNGNRVSDTFILKGPDANAPCYSSSCTATWTYDARERLTHENLGSGTTKTYTVDVQGNVTQETASDGSSVTRTFSGQRLMTQTTGGVQHRYIYDSLGNQDCIVKAAYGGTTCPAHGNTNLIEDNVYDYKNRLAAHYFFNGAAAASKVVSYTNDPLDRPLQQVDSISGQGTTTYDFTYVGVTDALSKEVLSGATNATKRYAYDAFGHRATIAETKAGTTNRYAYVYDPQMSVELLIDQNNVVKESYDYAAYGVSNGALSHTAAGFDAKTNPYRYTGKRLDSGSGTYDMGARRYSPSTGRFLQLDMFAGALANFGLASSPLTVNRYALAGANPVSFIELDGHRPLYIDEWGMTTELWAERAAAETSAQEGATTAAPATPEEEIAQILEEIASLGESEPDDRSLQESSEDRYGSLNARERAWCKDSVDHAAKCARVLALNEKIEKLLQAQVKAGYFTVDDLTDGRADAYKHALGSAVMALWWGPAVAKGFGDRHEALIARGIEAKRRKMDLHNNEVGRWATSTLALRIGSQQEKVTYLSTQLITMTEPGVSWGGRSLWVLGPVGATAAERERSGHRVYSIFTGKPVSKK
jgi:RHS repeat-associated protein